MIRLNLQMVQTCIMDAYANYLSQTPININVPNPPNHDILVTCVLHGTRFNCGFPGYDMAIADILNLKHWCITHPGGGVSFGFRGLNPTHPNTINITLTGAVMFNFHVNVNP